MQCWFSRVLCSWRSWLVFSWLCPAPLGHIRIPGTINRSSSSISPSSPNIQATWPGEGGLFEGPESWILPLLLEMNPQRACGPTEILNPMLNTQDQHLSHPHPLWPIILGESLTWMSPTILIQTMRHPHLRMKCYRGSQTPLGVQTWLFALTWGRSRRRGRCFSGRTLLQIKLLSETSEPI